VSNVRTIDVVAQALTGARVEMRQNAILSPGQIRELGRGECGIVQALQIGADLRTIYLACDNGLLAIRLPDDLAVAAVRALMSSQLNMPAEHVRELEKTRFQLGPDGRPVKVATEPNS
jgi:hypothetical protein